MGREIVKDMEDVAGDSIRGQRTVPLRWGRRRAARLAAGAYALVAVVAWLPFVAGPYGVAYALALLPLQALLGYVCWHLYCQRAALPDARLGRLLKVGMLLGLAALAVGEIAFAWI